MTRTQNKEKAKKWLRLGLQLLAEREPEQTEQPSFKDLASGAPDFQAPPYRDWQVLQGRETHPHTHRQHRQAQKSCGRHTLKTTLWAESEAGQHRKTKSWVLKRISTFGAMLKHVPRGSQCISVWADCVCVSVGELCLWQCGSFVRSHSSAEHNMKAFQSLISVFPLRFMENLYRLLH